MPTEGVGVSLIVFCVLLLRFWSLPVAVGLLGVFGHGTAHFLDEVVDNYVRLAVGAATEYV